MADPGLAFLGGLTLDQFVAELVAGDPNLTPDAIQQILSAFPASAGITKQDISAAVAKVPAAQQAATAPGGASTGGTTPSPSTPATTPSTSSTDPTLAQLDAMPETTISAILGGGGSDSGEGGGESGGGGTDPAAAFHAMYTSQGQSGAPTYVPPAGTAHQSSGGNVATYQPYNRNTQGVAGPAAQATAAAAPPPQAAASGYSAPPPTDSGGGNAPGLNAQQTQNARTIIATGKALGVNDNGIITALAVAGVEANWQNYSNVNVPQSQNYPHQAVGSDHDSIGLFQQRPSTGWAHNIALGMDPVYQAAAFFGGSPNSSAPGLMDIRGWQNANPGVISQTVQGSAFPDRYAKYVSWANQIWSSLNGSTPGLALPFTPTKTGGYNWAQAAPAPKPQAPPVAAVGTYVPPTGSAKGAPQPAPPSWASPSNAQSRLNRANPTGPPPSYRGGRGVASAGGAPPPTPSQRPVRVAAPTQWNSPAYRVSTPYQQAQPQRPQYVPSSRPAPVESGGGTVSRNTAPTPASPPQSYVPASKPAGSGGGRSQAK
jgi:hypothetical protein